MFRAFIVLDPDFFDYTQGKNAPVFQRGHPVPPGPNGEQQPHSQPHMLSESWRSNRYSIQMQAALGVANHVQFLINRLMGALLPVMADFENQLGQVFEESTAIKVSVSSLRYEEDCRNAQSLKV